MKGQAVSLGKSSCLALVMVFALTLLTTHAVQAQTFSVLHTFTGGTDGANPYAGVTIGPGGVLYGTAYDSGSHNAGTVFKLTPKGSSWALSPLYEFTGGSDGANPLGGVVIGPSSALYGTTQYGGTDNYGVVFELRPPATVCRSVTCYWGETVLYTFTGMPDGEGPYLENLAFDQRGNIYGTTYQGGEYGLGTAFELMPSGGGWTEGIIHNFGHDTDGQYPASGVIFDTFGNLYGTTEFGGTVSCGAGANCGTVYQLMSSIGGWQENVVSDFEGGGEEPVGPLTIDASGNLYGTTYFGGPGDGGEVFKLASGDGFAFSVLSTSNCNSYAGVTMDGAGDLFGVCADGGAYRAGWVYELTNCSTMCIVNDLHDFCANRPMDCPDGELPVGAPALDANGNLYGTTFQGGTTGTNCDGTCGVVWEIAGVGAPRKN